MFLQGDAYEALDAYADEVTGMELAEPLAFNRPFAVDNEMVPDVLSSVIAESMGEQSVSCVFAFPITSLLRRSVTCFSMMFQE